MTATGNSLKTTNWSAFRDHSFGFIPEIFLILNLVGKMILKLEMVGKVVSKNV